MKVTCRATDKVGRRAGFSLIHLVVLVTIIAALAASAIPTATSAPVYELRQGTRQEMRAIVTAVDDYFWDTEALPAEVLDLVREPIGGLAGWRGPYLPGVIPDEPTSLSGYEVDGWSRDYRLETAGDVLTLTSMGEDADWDSGRDIVARTDVTWLRRKRTIGRLQTVNQAIAVYNELYGDTAPLPANYPVLVSMLIADDVLPNTVEYDVDGWGATFVEDPLGVSPVECITTPSISISSACGSGGNGNGNGN